jgi:hypothetical protein
MKTISGRWTRESWFCTWPAIWGVVRLDWGRFQGIGERFAFSTSGSGKFYHVDRFPLWPR